MVKKIDFGNRKRFRYFRKRFRYEFRNVLLTKKLISKLLSTLIINQLKTEK